MRVEVTSAFWANGRVYQVGDLVDLADAFVRELMLSKKVIPARDRALPDDDEPAKPKKPPIRKKRINRSPIGH